MSSSRPSDPIRVRPLPDGPSLEHLRGQARDLQRAVRAGEPDALAVLGAFDSDGVPGPDQRAGYPLTTAQLVVARSYGFGSWRRLRERVQTITDYSRWPEPPESPATGTGVADLPTDPDVLLRAGCLNYTRDDPHMRDAARALLSAQPSLAEANLHTAAAAGATAAVRRLLSAAPGGPGRAANAVGGPFDWPPLLYLAYSRLGDGPDRSALDTAAVLLDAGADPNAGYLWQAMTSPFTALTGAFGGGEQHQPAHEHAAGLARLLLDAGADPNDNQALYNRMFAPANDHLQLLFGYGLGTDVDSPWRARLGDSYPTPAQMLGDQLSWAARQGMPERVRLLLAAGVAADSLGQHPVFGGRTPYRLAVAAGHDAIAEMLLDAGADPG